MKCLVRAVCLYSFGVYGCVLRLMLEDPHLVEPEIPRGGQHGSEGLPYPIGNAPGIKAIDDDISCQDVENYKSQVLDQAHMTPVSGAEREGALEREVEYQTGDKCDRRCNPEVNSEYLVHEGQQSKIHGERRAAYQEELDQMTALNDEQDFGR